MVDVYEEVLCGKVDRVPGYFYVSTQFWHIQFVPIVPLRSYIVLEGSEQGNVFRGKPIPLRLKSVLVGYLRGWLAAIAFVSGGTSGMATVSFKRYIPVGRRVAVRAQGRAKTSAGRSVIPSLAFHAAARSGWFQAS